MSHVRQLVVMPDDGIETVISALDGAQHAIDVKMFLLTEPALITALSRAQARGVRTRVILNKARRSGEEDNGTTAGVLQAAGVAVQDGNPAFDVTHEKSMVIDGEMAAVKSLNWAPENFTSTRDFAVFTRDQDEVAEVTRGFEADWSHTEFDGGPDARLVWCKGNARERLGHLIDGARHTLWLQNERYQDETIIEHLVRARSRGVHIKVLAKPVHTLKRGKVTEGLNGLRLLADVGAKVHRLRHLKLHGKIIVADEKRAIIGSMNLAPGTFDSRRELGIEVHDDHILHRLGKVFEHDWDHSHPLDLTEEAVEADLTRHRAHDPEHPR
jgi:phosphatidylserine/phosphatidylglycerophosphate/cardiolipin synthase-like enzyme